MTNATKLIAGLLLITVPAIEFGGTFLLRILSGKHSEFTEFQRSMFRAGHAHAGVLVILALAAANRMGGTDRFRSCSPSVSAGFSARPIGESRTRPGRLIALLWIGVLFWPQP